MVTAASPSFSSLSFLRVVMSLPDYDGNPGPYMTVFMVHAQTIFTRWLRIDNNKHGYKNVLVSDTYFSIKIRFNVLNASSVDICTELIRCFVGER